MTKTTSFCRPLIPITGSWIFGIIIGNLFPGYSTILILLSIFAFIGITCLYLHNRSELILPLIFIYALGYLSIQPWAAPHLSKRHISNYLDKNRLTVQGRVCSHPIIGGDRSMFELEVLSITEKKETAIIDGKIKVTVFNERFAISQGDLIAFKAKIKSIKNFNNPNAFDYQKFLQMKGIWGASYVSGKDVQRRSGHPNHQFSYVVNRIRGKIAHHIDRAVSDDPGTILKALIIGRWDPISKKIRARFNGAGTGHILAISGLHVGLLAYIVFKLICHILIRFSYFMWQGTTKRWAALMTFPIILFYGFIAGMSPSTQRAIIIVSVFLFSHFSPTDTNPLNSTCLAALIILSLWPPALFLVSFQLSFAAVLAIIFGLSIITPFNPNDGLAKKTMKKGLVVVWITLCAILGTLPLTLYYFNSLSFMGLVSNLFVIPLLGYLIIPLGLVGTVLIPVSPSLAGHCFSFAGVAIEKMDYWVNILSQCPWASFKIFTPTKLEILLFYTVLGSFLHIVFLVIKKSPKKQIYFFYTIIFPICVLILFCDIGYWVHQRYFKSNVSVTALDVRHGSSSLIELPKGYTILVDGGGFSDNSIFDIGKYILAPFLWQKKIMMIDLVILTHPDSDHLNGLLYILQNFKVRTVWSNHQKVNTSGFQTFNEIIKDKNIFHPPFDDIPSQTTINGVTLKILNPQKGFVPAPIIDEIGGLNNNSIVLKIIYNNVSLLLPGDIQHKKEHFLVKKMGPDLTATVLFSPHHGCNSSNSEEFIEIVNPKIAIISAGNHNRFRCPHPSVLKTLRQNNIQIYSTNLLGAISLDIEGDTVLINSVRNKN